MLLNEYISSAISVPAECGQRNQLMGGLLQLIKTKTKIKKK